jgi:aryl-alcohol dehydrogenase-like predicted oxidoreductase
MDMEYRKLGKSDLEVSSICFGAWAAGGWMWGGTERKDAVFAIRRAYEMGVTSIDTAPIYGQGTSEEIVGEAIKDLPREKIQILTKYGMRWDLAKGDLAFKSTDVRGNKIDIYKYAGKESIIKECEDSLRRLNTNYIDLYQIHWPDATTPIEETMEAIARLIGQGKIRYAGVCNYNAEQVKEAKKYVDIVSNQVPYSMVNRGIEADVVPYCLEQNISILAYSPLERGLLTGKMKPGYVFQKGDHRAGLYFFTDENIERTDEFLEKIRPLAEKKGATLAQLVLRWTIAQPGITIALAGARNQKQSAENAQAMSISLSPDELAFINQQLAPLQLNKKMPELQNANS